MLDKKELRMIYKLIDLHTEKYSEDFGRNEFHDVKIIKDYEIEKLKGDIKEILYEGDN